MGSHVDHVRSYYEALNGGDPEAVAAHFTEDATHYYTRLGPHEGAETIGQMTEWAVENIDAQWYVENAIEADDQVLESDEGNNSVMVPVPTPPPVCTPTPTGPTPTLPVLRPIRTPIILTVFPIVTPTPTPFKINPIWTPPVLIVTPLPIQPP